MTAFWKFALACGLVACTPAALGDPVRTDGAASSATSDAEEQFSVHGQFTNVTQFHPSFQSPYRGPNSLDPGNRGNETVDLTLFLGARPWRGGEVFVNPEVDQGFGLSNTVGAAGFPSGEAYKVGATEPYVRLHRAFLRQTFNLGGEEQSVEPSANQLGGARTADNLVLTIGKFSVVDVFDNNGYAHDPKSDFLNWSIIDAGAFDYAADAWGYTYGASFEWTQSWWTLRGAAFDLSREPNSKRLQRDFEQFSVMAEAEGRYELYDQPGKLRLLVYMNRGRMANYMDAIRAAAIIGSVPDVAAVRRYATRPGLVLNLEQQLTDGLGLFARASINDGRKEAYEFTEINRSISAGLSLKGDRWARPDDTVGLAAVVNGLSNPALAYLRGGGLGILIGDGRLDHYGLEKIIETYYSARVVEGVAISIDYQYLSNPAYNADRGPVSVLGFRFHAEL
ncbi:MAG TPA: carbohydrate porin [Alphaproteobacteria bacterium]|nr:carbohydrate porin [Alphaproteobacteria bacterium]